MASVNPIFYSGDRLEKHKVRAVDGHTWQAGQFGRYTDSGVVPCKSEATSISLQFAQTQATATSSSQVWVNAIPSSASKFIMAVTSAGADAKANPSMIGGNFGLAVNSCVCTISRGNDSDEFLHVHDILPYVEGYKNDTSDSPGYAIVSIVESARTAEGAGV